MHAQCISGAFSYSHKMPGGLGLAARLDFLYATLKDFWWVSINILQQVVG
jgi:hypothetical protein